MKKLFIWLLVITIILLFLSVLFFKNYIKVADRYIKVEIADSNQERTLGLSYRKSLDKNIGMLFVHEREGIYPYWMFEMKTPLDIIFLDKDFNIVDYHQNAIPCESERNCSTITSKFPIKYVLEVNSGYIEENDLKIGSKLETNILTFVP